jgi:hypothetical protein
MQAVRMQVPKEGKMHVGGKEGAQAWKFLFKSSDTPQVSDYEQSNGCQANICSTCDIPKATVLD